MSDKLRSKIGEALGDMEADARQTSRIVSLLAVTLMVLGFADGVLNGMALSVPGSSVLPVSMLVHVSQVPFSLLTMSVGVLLLGLLPLVRVLLAVVQYTSQRGTLDAVVSLVVLGELLMSMRAGG